MPKMGWIVVAVSLSLATNAAAQVDTAWVRRFPGYHPYAGGVADMAVDSHGDICILGTSWTIEGYANLVTLKFSPNGDLLWSQSFDTGPSIMDMPVRLQVDSDRNVYIAATSDQLRRVLKYSPEGSLLWNAVIDTTPSPYCNGISRDMRVDGAGNVYITGRRRSCTPSEMFIVQCDASGSELWSREHSDALGIAREGLSLALTDDQNVYVAAEYWDHADLKIAVIHYTNQGDLVGLRILHDVSASFKLHLNVMADKSVVIAGSDHDGFHRPRLVRIAADGTVLSTHEYLDEVLMGEFTGAKLDSYGYVALATLGGGIYTALVRPDGDTIWVRRVDSPLRGVSGARCNALDQFDYIYTGGYKTYIRGSFWDDEDLVVVAYDRSGSLRWEYRWGSNSSDDFANAIIVDDQLNVYVGGESDGDIIIIKLLQENPLIRVGIDILPNSCPNIINTGGIDLGTPIIRPGAAAANWPTVPCAILGTKSFDVSRFDASTIEIAGLSPLSHRLLDVSRPVEPRETECECTTKGADGYTDLVLYFDQEQFVAALGPVNDGEVRTLTLTGKTKTGVPLSGSDCVTINEGPTRISPLASAGEKPESGFAAYPNPFNAATVVSFSLATESDVRLDVYDVLGRHLATLIDEMMPAGEHQVSWDAAGRASGVYFARLSTSAGMMTRKMVLVR